MTGPRPPFPRWPLALIGAPAAVAIWSGWVGLGGLCGFGPVHVLPGIVPGFRINTAITLPVGVEAYAAFALGAWLGSVPIPDQARLFARRSAIGALVLGMTGQVIFHLLSAAHAKAAPWPVVVLVSCMPVGVLGLSAALAHLLRQPAETPTEPDVPGSVAPDVVTAAKASYAATVAAGNPWSRNQLVEQFGLTRVQASAVIASCSPPVAELAVVSLNGDGPQ